MHIKSYRTERFAGLKDVELEFTKGLNVILGANESGKSSIIEGIHSTLFKDIKLKRNNNLDLDFTFKFMPKPNGDYINGRVVLGSEKGDYRISKEWGSSESIELLTPEGNILKGEGDIKEKLKKILSFGESTYSNIVFAKQRDLKQALFNIINDKGVTQEINDLLRMTLMELDGISIDSIEKNIEKALDDLYKRWNRDKNYPDNNRGINNPYKVGLGEILESYYKKESLKLKMDQGEETEKAFEEISIEIKTTKDRRDKLNLEKMKLEAIEEDVNSRAILNMELLSLEKDLKELMTVNIEWPKSQQLLESLSEKLVEVQNKKKAFTKEKKDLEKFKRKLVIEKKLEAIEETRKDIEKLEESIMKIPRINEEDIDKLSKMEKELSSLEITMKAGKMIGVLKKAGHKPIHISKDFNEPEVLEMDEEFQADGLILITYGDEFKLEIKTGEVDFEKLNEDYRLLREEYKNKLEDLDIDSLEIGKINLKSIQDKENEVDKGNEKLKMLLEGSREEELAEELEDLKDVSFARQLEEIEEDLEKLSDEEVELTAEKRAKEAEVRSWEDKYIDHSNLFDEVIEKRSRSKEIQKKIEKLQPLPEEFPGSEEFKQALSWLKEEVNTLFISLEDLSSQFYEAKGQLLDDTYEEIKREYLEVEKEFAKNIKKGEKLLKIHQVFLETKKRLASNPMESLVNEFARLLSLITDGRYSSGDIDEDFKIRLENPNGEIPIELLSAGTHDAVTLALRFSLIKHIFQDKGGYVILDDCLVDLDPERKAQSISLINDFAEEYQIIFTTCDPQTAEMLGGRIIEL